MKLKTHKATSKKVKVTKGKKRKYILRTSGQDHFNAREDGKAGRNKRRSYQVSRVDLRNVKNQLPYA